MIKSERVIEAEPNHQDIMYPIGDDRILCVDTTGGINLFTIPEPEYIVFKQKREPDKGAPSIKSAWSSTFPYSSRIRYSRLYHDNATYRFVASSSRGIWGFTIPTTTQSVPSSIRFSTFYSWQTVCFPGLYKAFVPNEADQSGVRIEYDWEGNVDGGVVIGTVKGMRFDIMQPTFDEESGRCVYHRRDRSIILDLMDTRFQP